MIRSGGTRALAALLAVVALAAGCSGLDSGEKADSNKAEEASSTTTPADFHGSDQSDFCKLLVKVDTSTVGLGTDPTTAPSDVQKSFQTILGALAETVVAAPADIKPYLALLRQGMDNFDKAMAKVGYSYEALAQSADALEVSAGLNDPAFADAGAKITVYKTGVCHL